MTTPLRARADELEAAVERMTPAPWEWWTSNSVKRLSHKGDGDVAYSYAHSSGADIEIRQPDMAGIVALRNSALPLVRDLMAERERLVEAEKARAIRCGQLLMELGAANKRIAQLEHRPETKAEALRSLGLTRGKAADGTEVWE